MSMIRLSFFVLLVFFSGSGFAYEYRVGVVDYPPHIVAGETGLSGPAMDYIKELFEKHGDAVSFSLVPASRGEIQLLNGDIDLLLPVENLLDNGMKIDKPLFNLVPGLCFRKEGFIPILSATGRFDRLTVGYADGTEIVSPLNNSKAKLVALKGTSGHERGIKMLIAGRIDAFYHSNPAFIYHKNNPISKEIACSYFHGLERNVYITVSPVMSAKKLIHAQESLSVGLEEESYIDFFNK